MIEIDAGLLKALGLVLLLVTLLLAIMLSTLSDKRLPRCKACGAPPMWGGNMTHVENADGKIISYHEECKRRIGIQ